MKKISGEAPLGYIRRYGKPIKPNRKRKVRVRYRLYLHVTIENKIKHYTLTSNMMSISRKNETTLATSSPLKKHILKTPRQEASPRQGFVDVYLADSKRNLRSEFKRPRCTSFPYGGRKAKAIERERAEARLDRES